MYHGHRTCEYIGAKVIETHSLKAPGFNYNKGNLYLHHAKEAISNENVKLCNRLK